MEIMLNAAIFPKVVGMVIENKDRTGVAAAIDLPRGANLLYIQNIKNRNEINLLKKYSDQALLTDDDYKALLNLFITNSPRTQAPPIGSIDFLSHYGVELYSEGDAKGFRLIESQIPNIKAETWECIALDVLNASYTDIINCFDFGGISINLSAWKTYSEDDKQSLLNALRSAWFFTLVGYLYGDDKDLYPSFSDFFDNEFFKRVTLVHAIWQTLDKGEKTEYLPLFDNFFNLQSLSSQDLIKIIQTILGNTDIVLDERQMIKNRLIDGAKLFHAENDPASISLEQSLIKPVVNYVIELQTAEEDLQASMVLLDSQLFNQSIDATTP